MTERRRAPSVVATLLLAAVATVGAFLLWLHDSATRPGPATEARIIDVAAGNSLRQVFRQLEAQQLLPRPRAFELYLRWLAPDYRGRALPAIQRGRYRFGPDQTPLEIFTALRDGRVMLTTVTLVEGWTFREFRAALSAHPEITRTLEGLTDAEVMARLGKPGQGAEGRFAPDTYHFMPGSPDTQILAQAFDLQSRRLARAWASRSPDLPLRSADEALVLASIVEKETGAAAERPRIAGVFINRLRSGMRLQSDPTVIYGLGEGFDGDLRKADLRRDTPFNTYTRRGLPPAAIAMPGEAALRASVQPAATDEVYFVALGDGTGRHAFSATLDEHNTAVRRYLRRLREAP
ncbi:MAG: endolytic transglycosylase MltG [Pseudomonadota bacterium]